VPKILLVEDNDNNRDLLSRRLIRKAYEVAQAVNGVDAVRMASTENPALILLDMRLTEHGDELQGTDVARALKGSEATRHIPIIALTAEAMKEDRERALAAGCDDYDSKPVDLPRLLGKIEALLPRAGGDTPPAAAAAT
jgi:CheY-like chemotaxis protein